MYSTREQVITFLLLSLLLSAGAFVFLQLPFNAAENLQHIVLILNTVLLLTGLIALELVYSERPKDQRAHLKLFIPLMFVLIGLLIYAAYRQAGN